jgi:hypothetical protein
VNEKIRGFPHPIGFAPEPKEKKDANRGEVKKTWGCTYVKNLHGAAPTNQPTKLIYIYMCVCNSHLYKGN